MVEGFEYERILEKSPFGYALYKICLENDGKINDLDHIAVNDAFSKITGLDKNTIIHKKLTEVLPNIKSNKFDLVNYYADVAINNLEREYEQYFEVFKRWYKIKLYSPKKYYVVSYFIDITDQIKERELFKSTLLSITEGIIATDLDGKIIIINESAERITQWEEDEILNSNIFEVFGICDTKSESILNIIHNGESIKDKSCMLKSKTGIDIPIINNISPVKNGMGEIFGMVISFKDITEKIIKDKELDYITYHDSLTGVYNRSFFKEEIKNIDVEENLPISVIMGDVNGLKLTNDAFGHLMGDKLLESAANIMKKVCRENDIVVRWGGDEFIILLPKTQEETVEKISERIKEECIKENIDMLNVSISLGYDTKNIKEDNIMKAVTNAEEMMYKIKMLESKSIKSRTINIIINTLYEKSKRDDIHSKNVSKICKLIGQNMDMSKEKISELEILGGIHDIGKVGVSQSILNKVGKLNEEEWQEIKRHPQIGYHIVSSSSDISFLGESILAHQEWYDGSGYPKGLKGDEIPLMARILSIADSYEAMISHRFYRKTLTKDEAVQELIKYSGTQFDSELVEIFISKVIKKLDLLEIIK